jgi:hypothetical protein
MHTLGRQKRAVTTEPNSSEDENLDPNGRPKRQRMLRKPAPIPSDMHVLQAMMEKSEKCRELFEGKIVLALEESTKVYERTQDRFLSVLQDKLN